MPVSRYAIVGFGNVGAALARYAAERAPRLRLVAAVDSTAGLVSEHGLDARALADGRDAGRRIGDDPRSRRLGFVDLPHVDCVVVCLPTTRETGEPGLTWARAAIAAGAGAVLADKGPALRALPELEASAARRGTFVGASATVGAALPTLSFARRELAGAEIREISAVLNGTSNLILTRMRERGEPFETALAAAQADGAAEPDPSDDVLGWDTAVKLTILARALLDPRLSLADVARRGIDAVDDALEAEARATGGRIRLVGRARRTSEGVRLSVAPEVVAPSDPFFLVEGASKAIRFATDGLGEVVVSGGASGRRATAAALLRDMLSGLERTEELS